MSNPITFTLTDENKAQADWKELSEYAAWYQMWHANVGTWEVERTPDKSFDFHTRRYRVTVSAISGQGYFAAHYGGVPVSRNYDMDQHKGRPGKIVIYLSAVRLILDPRIQVPADRYDAILDEAIAEAQKDYDFALRNLQEKLASPSHYTAIKADMTPWWEARRFASSAQVLDKLIGCKNSRAQRGYEKTEIDRSPSQPLILKSPTYS